MEAVGLQYPGDSASAVKPGENPLFTADHCVNPARNESGVKRRIQGSQPQHRLLMRLLMTANII